MVEYNFKPDYTKWWKKRKSLNQDQLISLLLGFNPDDIKKQKTLSTKKSKSHEEKEWEQAFGNYYNDTTFLAGGGAQGFNDLLEWKDDKGEFVKDAYESRLLRHEWVVDELVTIGALRRDEKLERYKDFSMYKLDFAGVEVEKINSEEEAFSVLLGLTPKYFIRFCELDSRVDKKPKDERGYSPCIHFTPDDKWFFYSYGDFLDKTYHGIPGRFTVTGALKKSKALGAWDKNFKQYCQKLHDNGFIFKKEAYEGLNAKGIKLEYSKDAWALEFYRHWLKKGGWTLLEALHLFMGHSPDNEKSSFRDLSQNPFVLYHDGTHYWSWDLFKNGYEDLDELLSRHAAVGKTDAVPWRKKENEYLYAPEKIIPWLMENTLYLPPKALLQVLEIHESKEAEDQRATENEKAGISLINQRRSMAKEIDWHKEAMPFVHEFFQKDGKMPSRETVAQHLLSKHSKFSFQTIRRHLIAKLLDTNYQQYKKERRT